MPDWYKDRPEILGLHTLFFEAFESLSTDRTVSMGEVGPIPYSSIANYAERMGFGFAMIRVFEIVLRTMDATWQKWVQDERKSASAPAPDRTKTKTRTKRP